MKRVVCVLLTAAFALSTSLATAQEKPKPTPEEAFKKRDKNGDGKLSLDEFVGKSTGDKATKAQETFKKRDKNADGFLSQEEFQPKKKNS